MKAKPDGQTRGASQRNDGKVAGKIDPRRKPKRRSEGETGRLTGDASRKVKRKAQPENAATGKPEVGFVRQGRKVSRRRKSTVGWRAAPKGFSSRGSGRCSAGSSRRGIGDASRRGTRRQRRRDTTGDKRWWLVRRQGRKIDQWRRSPINLRAAPADATPTRVGG